MTKDFYSGIRVFYNFTMSKVWKSYNQSANRSLTFVICVGRLIRRRRRRRRRKRQRHRRQNQNPPQPPSPNPHPPPRHPPRPAPADPRSPPSGQAPMSSPCSLKDRLLSSRKWVYIGGDSATLGWLGVSRMHLLNSSTDRIPNSRRFIPNIGKTFFFFKLKHLKTIVSRILLGLLWFFEEIFGTLPNEVPLELFQSYGMIYWDMILRYDIEILIWDISSVNFFLWETWSEKIRSS